MAQRYPESKGKQDLSRERHQPTPAHKRVFFRLEQDEDDWPPVDAESLWAVPQAGDTLVVDNIPFFVRGVSFGDVITTAKAGDVLFFEKVVHYSGHSTLRLIFFDDSKARSTLSRLESMGCEWEESHVDCLFSVDIPPSLCYQEVASLLSEATDAGVLEFEEAAIAANHQP